MKKDIFTPVKNRCMLHGRVFVMNRRVACHTPSQFRTIKYIGNMSLILPLVLLVQSNQK